MSEASVILTGLGFPESTRWHDGRAWLCNWGAGEVLAVGADGASEVMAPWRRKQFHSALTGCLTGGCS